LNRAVELRIVWFTTNEPLAAPPAQVCLESEMKTESMRPEARCQAAELSRVD
jgi:hypothetical protein